MSTTILNALKLPSLPRIFSVVAVVTLLSAAAPASATPLLPGDTVSPPATAGCCPSPLDPNLLELVFGGWSNGGAFSGGYAAAVYRRADGFLDFLYQVGPDEESFAVGSVAMRSFAGWTTDVFYYVEEGTIAPTSASRSASGDEVRFDFSDPALGADSVSKVLVIRTNAPNYTAGNVDLYVPVIEGPFEIEAPPGFATFAAFAPAEGAPVPEPATLLISTLGLAGVVAFRRFDRRPK